MGVNTAITRGKTCSFDEAPEQRITRSEVLELVENDLTLLFREGDYINWFPKGGADSNADSDYWFVYDEEIGIIYSQGTRWEEIPKMVEIAEKLHANVIGEGNEIYLPSGEVLDEEWKGETLWQSFRRWMKGQPRSLELKPVFRWDK